MEIMEMDHHNSTGHHNHDNMASNDVVKDHLMMMDGHMMPADNSIAMMMMQMTFYAGVDVTVLITQWKTSNVGELVGTALFWCLVAFLHQATKRVRRVVAKHYTARMSARRSSGGFTKLTEDGGSSPNTEPGNTVITPENATFRARVELHLLQSLFQFLQTTTSFILMLVFMTYNVWLAVAIVVGDTLGYIVFSFDIKYDTQDSCC